MVKVHPTECNPRIITRAQVPLQGSSDDHDGPDVSIFEARERQRYAHLKGVFFDEPGHRLHT